MRTRHIASALEPRKFQPSGVIVSFIYFGTHVLIFKHYLYNFNWEFVIISSKLIIIKVFGIIHLTTVVNYFLNMIEKHLPFLTGI